MKKFVKTLVFAWVWLLLHPGTAHAQPAAANPPWSLRLGAGSTYDGNLLFIDPNGSGELGTTLQGGLARNFTFDGRGDLSLAGDASQLFYSKSPDLNHFNYGVGASGSYAFTRRFSGTISSNLTSSYAQDAKLLTDVGLVLPKVVTRTLSVSTSFTYALGPKTNVSVAGTAQSVGFESITFTDGANVSMLVSLGRRLTASQTLSISQSYQRTFSDAGAGAIQALLATWQMSKGRAGFTATGGIHPYRTPGQDEYRFAPATGAGWTMQFNQSHSITINYNRTVEQAFGLDQILINRTVDGAYTLSHGRTTVTLRGTYARNTDSLNKNMSLIGNTTNASIGYRIARNLSVVADTSVYFRNATSAPAVRSYLSSISLFYGTSFR